MQLSTGCRTDLTLPEGKKMRDSSVGVVSRIKWKVNTWMLFGHRVWWWKWTILSHLYWRLLKKRYDYYVVPGDEVYSLTEPNWKGKVREVWYYDATSDGMALVQWQGVPFWSWTNTNDLCKECDK